LDIQNKGELDEHEAMMMFERRGSIKTARELRQLVMAMDQNSNHKLSLLEWLCAHFGKSYADLNDFVDEEARARAMEEAMRAGEEAKRAEEEIARAAQQKELQASLRAAALERESKLVIHLICFWVKLPFKLFYCNFVKLLLDRRCWNESLFCTTGGKRRRRDQDKRTNGNIYILNCLLFAFYVLWG
jgi:hypothetical protein